MPQKIIIIGPAYPLRGGGMATFNEKLAEELQNEGNDVEIVTFSLQYPKILFPGKTQLSTEAPPKHLRITPLLNSIKPSTWRTTADYIIAQKPDVVIVRYWMPFMALCLGVVARRVQKNASARLICIADNITPHEFFPFQTRLTKFFVQPFDKFVVMSQSVLDDLKRINPHKMGVLAKHPLYDNFGAALPQSEALKHLGLSQKYNYVLFFGFVRKYKGLDLLLQAFAHPRLYQSNVRLIIAGEFYENSQPYFDFIQDNQLQKHIVPYYQFIANDQVRYFFSAADVLAQPYKHATQSGVTQVAYHFDLPMVVTDVGGLAELVPHNQVGYVVQPDAAAIANAIADFFDKNQKNTFAKNANVFKKQFSWAIFIDTLLR